MRFSVARSTQSTGRQSGEQTSLQFQSNLTRMFFIQPMLKSQKYLSHLELMMPRISKCKLITSVSLYIYQVYAGNGWNIFMQGKILEFFRICRNYDISALIHCSSLCLAVHLNLPMKIFIGCLRNTFRMIETVTFGSWKPVAFFSIDHTCARGDSFLWSSKGFSGILGCYWGTYLTHDSTKGPETKTGGDHEEGDADEEEFVCHCQIKDVQIGDRLHFGVAQYNVDHQGVAH